VVVREVRAGVVMVARRSIRHCITRIRVCVCVRARASERVQEKKSVSGDGSGEGKVVWGDSIFNHSVSRMGVLESSRF
jgi:phosphotransferase system IIB component